MVPAAAAMNQAPDPNGPEQPDRDARGSAPLQPGRGGGGGGGPARGMQQTPTPCLPQLLQNAAKLLDKNLFSVSTPNPLLPSPASLQLAQLQAQLTLHRLKLAQTAVTNNTAAATVLNQVLSKVAMSQPLFNQLRHPSMFNNPQGHAGGPGVANTRFPPGGLHFPAQNSTLAAAAAAGGTLGPVGNLQNQNPNAMTTHPFGGVISQTSGQQAVVMGLNKTGVASSMGGFYDYSKQVFPSDAEHCSPHGFVTSGSHSFPSSSGGETYEGNFGKHDNQPGFQKEFYGTTAKVGQHTPGVQSLSFVADPHNSHQVLSQKGEAGPIIHETEINNQWENPSTFAGQNKPDNMPNASMWPSTSVRYEIRNDLYNPEEPTPDTKFSAGAPLAFSRANSSKQNFSNSRMFNNSRQTQEPTAAASDLSVRPHGLSDFHSIAPLCFPHVCTICDKKVFDLKDWDQHVKGNLHIQKCMAFSENTDIRCVLSSAEGILHSSANNTTVCNLSNVEAQSQPALAQPGRMVYAVSSTDYPLNVGSSYNSTSSFGQPGSTFSSVPSAVNVVFQHVSIVGVPQGFSSTITLHMVHLFKVPPELTGDDIIANYFWIGRPDIMQQTPLPQRKCTPGRVVHICNLPEGSCTENDVINLGIPFGKVTNYILMKSTNQAFLEMAYTEAAQAMVQYYKEKPAMINDDKLLIRMSKRYRELQLKKPGKNVAAIIQDIHSQRERDMWETDRYGPERPRSRSPINRSLSPRSRTPSFTSCSSPHSPLSTNRTDWGNGREQWDQPSYSRREEEREVLPWRENGEEKRERTDTWVHERKQHYLRHLDKLDLEERVEGTRGHREKYLRGGSPSTKGVHPLPAHKTREEDYYRKPIKQKSDKFQKPTTDATPKSKRKEETKLREHKHSHCEDSAMEETSEQKLSKMPDGHGQKQSDTEKFKEADQEPKEEISGVTEKIDLRKGKGTKNEVDKEDSNMENSPFSTNKPVKEADNSTETKEKAVQEQDFESGSEMEAETWYPTNMEELVTVDEVGEDDLIMEPDITELEEIVTVGQKQEVCSEGNPIAAAGLEVKNEQSLLNRSKNKSHVMEASLRSEEETAGTLNSSEGDNAATKALHLNTDTDQKPDELHEGRPLRDSNYHDMERNENTDVHLKVDEPPKEELLQQSETFVDDKEIDSLESENRTAMEVLVKSSQEETSCGNQEHEKTQVNYRSQEMKAPAFPDVESKRTHFSPLWEQEDVFTELSIPLGVEFVVPRTGFYCKLCGLFYTNEDTAKTRHCRSTVHYKNLQKYLSQLAEDNLRMNEKESNLAQDDVGIVPHFEKKKL